MRSRPNAEREDIQVGASKARRVRHGCDHWLSFVDIGLNESVLPGLVRLMFLPRAVLIKTGRDPDCRYVPGSDTMMRKEHRAGSDLMVW